MCACHGTRTGGHHRKHHEGAECCGLGATEDLQHALTAE